MSDATCCRGRTSSASWRSENHLRPARRSNAIDPNKSFSSSAGVSTGHMRSSASRTSRVSRSRDRSWDGSISWRDFSESSWKKACSRCLRPALCPRARRRAWATSSADSWGEARSRSTPEGMTAVSCSGRWRSRTALASRRRHQDVALDPCRRGSVVARGPDVGHQVGGDRDLDPGLTERGQHLLDVGEEQAVRPDDQHALALEREAVGVEEVPGRRWSATTVLPVPGPPWTTSTPGSGRG